MILFFLCEMLSYPRFLAFFDAVVFSVTVVAPGLLLLLIFNTVVVSCINSAVYDRAGRKVLAGVLAGTPVSALLRYTVPGAAAAGLFAILAAFLAYNLGYRAESSGHCVEKSAQHVVCSGHIKSRYPVFEKFLVFCLCVLIFMFLQFASVIAVLYYSGMEEAYFLENSGRLFILLFPGRFLQTALTAWAIIRLSPECRITAANTSGDAGDIRKMAHM